MHALAQEAGRTHTQDEEEKVAADQKALYNAAQRVAHADRLSTLWKAASPVS